MPRKRLDPTSVATKTSITLDAATMAILRARSGPGENASGLVRLLLGWYDEIIRRERPELSDAEWSAIRDALNGTWLLAEQGGIGMIASALALEVSDACRLNGLADKWKIDGPGLVARLAAMSFAARVAVIDDVVRFWAEAGREAAAAVMPCTRDEAMFVVRARVDPQPITIQTVGGGRALNLAYPEDTTQTIDDVTYSVWAGSCLIYDRSMFGDRWMEVRADGTTSPAQVVLRNGKDGEE